MDKKALRKQFLAERKQLSELQRIKLDDLLLLQFQQLNFQGIQTVLSYWPLAEKAEPNSFLCSRYLRFILPVLTIAYPVIDAAETQMQAIEVEEETVFKHNAWGIPEPQNGKSLSPETIDLVLVPLLIFDRLGYRVGYGKGYYDRLLANCRKDIVKIGFSYFEPVDKITDTDQFDVPLTYCITPQHIYEF
jgi:5-formyltetrahydrofolate cyclo-ligase